MKTENNDYICTMNFKLNKKALDYTLEALLVLTDTILRGGFFHILLGEVMGYDISMFEAILLGMLANLLLTGKVLDLTGIIKIALRKD